ncbi:MAG TPA: hypothetical protein VIR63_04140 [Pontiella sp.]
MKKTKPIHPRIPVLLSAFVCPGAGQFVQRRWLAGAIFSGGFMIGFCWFSVISIKVILDIYKLAFEFETHEPEPIALTAFIAPLAIATLFHLVSLFDVVIAQQRIIRTRSLSLPNNE